MENEIANRNPRDCRACDNVRGNKEVATGIYECAACGAIFGTCYLGDSYGFVKPFFAAAEVPAGQSRYFDFTTLGSNGVGRRHGWFDPATKLITQVG
jgi:hypothetical protein